MKKIFLTLALVLACFAGASAQKFALVDMDYILSNVPAYEMANEHLSAGRKKWSQWPGKPKLSTKTTRTRWFS